LPGVTSFRATRLKLCCYVVVSAGRTGVRGELRMRGGRAALAPNSVCPYPRASKRPMMLPTSPRCSRSQYMRRPATDREQGRAHLDAIGLDGNEAVSTVSPRLGPKAQDGGVNFSRGQQHGGVMEGQGAQKRARERAEGGRETHVRSVVDMVTGFGALAADSGT
jgi:hypothetical protein